MKKLITLIFPFIILIAIWAVVARLNIFPISLFPSPTAVGRALFSRVLSGALLLDIGASMYRFFLGYISASISAILIGLILGWFPNTWAFLNPIVQFLRPISPVAWLPFIVLWMGIGDIPAIVIIFLAAFFPILLTTVTAVNNIDTVYLKISANFGLSRRQTLLKIVFPAIFPQIVNGLHIAVGTAWIFLVAGEMAGTQSGLGYLIVDARNNLQTDVLLAAIIVIGILGLVLDVLIRYAEEESKRIWGLGITEGR
ncbi:ABC transporter permease [Megasphaera cerevisiae]|jgi:NitT/TauT family transport system permease protein|uniref:ABC transporter permease n=1 Tax=Megasphaera cerevisiae TaxID=39029 RepID=UPI000942E3B3|nr:ABC transporter permease [Megasphaera cerevisiae]OKY52296.1 sulfonate ABC transporter permease [Megasphaera cerevisiae]